MKQAKSKWVYIGDGVYARSDGYGIWLHASSHDDPTDKIYLEPSVFEALIKFEGNYTTKETKETKGETNHA